MVGLVYLSGLFYKGIFVEIGSVTSELLITDKLLLVHLKFRLMDPLKSGLFL